MAACTREQRSRARLRSRAALVCVASLALSCSGEYQTRGAPSGPAAPEAVVAARTTQQTDGAKTVLFGDLHVHTSFSPDAFLLSLPMMGGDGAHPPADACDYARFCAGLDFWSINDHAEGVTPRLWQETREAIRECNALSQGARGLDTVAFLGWEWTQVGSAPEQHYGHKNVVLRDVEGPTVPARAIAAPRPEFRVAALPPLARLLLPLVHFPERQRYFDYFLYTEEVNGTAQCPHDVDSRELPADCHEVARDPVELLRKLDEWGADPLLIPHGTAWGLSTPPLGSWEHQLTPALRPAAERQRLIEVYSGHGSSEEWRPFASLELDASGEAICPAPTDAYEPCCWRAGEIIRARCEDPASETCDALVAKARADHAASGVAGHGSIPGAAVEDWLDCGQCRDCFAPAYDLRPGMSAQYALASGAFRFGFIGSSDNHSARGGNGYKEAGRRQLTEARAATRRGLAAGFVSEEAAPEARSERIDVDAAPLAARRYVERGNSMLLSGGLAAVHARARTHDAIFDALDRREAYATTGDRILLWFDLLNGPHGEVPMGGEVAAQHEPPRFRVRALGSLEQRAGCPDHVTAALSPERIAALCLGECHHPGETRKRIARIEVVRITPGSGPQQAIEDPWRTFPCTPDPNGCQVEFEDARFARGGRHALYYVRAIQEPSPAINGAGLRCTYDDAGRCVEVKPCHSDERTPPDDDCLADFEERAWSSPIFVSPAAATAQRPR
jgi:hypothetical protein